MATARNTHRRDAFADEPRLELRRNMASKWIWVLLSADLHIVNRSETGFVTKQECVADADLKGFCLPAGT
jgi:hypothetical protein